MLHNDGKYIQASPPTIISDLVNILRNISWAYLEQEFNFAYRQVNDSHDLQAGIDLVAKYVADTDKYWYPWFISSLPFTARLYRLNDLRELFICQKSINDILLELNQCLEKLSTKDRSFAVNVSNLEKAQHEIIEKISDIYKVLQHKVTHTVDGTWILEIRDAFEIDSCCDDSANGEDCCCKVADENIKIVPVVFDGFTYIDKDKNSFDLTAVGLLGNTSESSRLAVRIQNEILNNNSFNPESLKESLDRYINKEIFKYRKINNKAEQVRQDELAKLKAENVLVATELRHLQVNKNEYEQTEKLLSKERNATLFSTSSLADSNAALLADNHNLKLNEQKILISSLQSNMRSRRK